jgi:CheY-like chemotaxis protein/nitrogen-specific signal transduction histidine kinase
VSKSLGESYYQLEQLNLELERARQAAQEARRLKAQFAAAVSHELRTPLNLVIGFSEMMVLSPSRAYGEQLPANYASDLQAIFRNAGHISALVDDILDLSQIDADRMALHQEWVKVDRIVDEAILTVEGLFRDRGLFLRATYDPELPPLYVDQTRIRQILINLLSNAARYVEQGGVLIRAEPDDGHVVISVSDTGPGIAPGELSSVFEEFFQVGGPRARPGTSGLGLTVSKRFAELHGGTLKVDSTVGQGSTFLLQLPLAPRPQNVSPTGVDWAERVASRVRGQPEPRVLVLDDGSDVGAVFQRYLDGYQIVRARNLTKAKAIVRSGPFRAVVWSGRPDVGGPNPLGPLPPELAGLPVIACPLRTTRRLSEELGVAGYLTKPVRRDQLRAALRTIKRNPRKVLVVDDDSDTLRLFSRMLQSLVADCEIRVAENGQHGLGLIEQWHPDIVLLDLLMPGVNGYDVLEAMRSDPSLQEVPVVVITARGLEEETVVAGAVTVSRSGGLSVGETMRWIHAGLESLVPASSFSECPAGPDARPASRGKPERRPRAPALVLEGSSTQ